MNSLNFVFVFIFLLFLANLIGITVASLVVFMVQGYGSLRKAWRHLLV